MGIYVNKGCKSFENVRNSTYVDKSMLIKFINSTLFTLNQYTCVCRARRFGKTTALNMLYAYYDCSTDSRHLFSDLRIAEDASFEKHLNKYIAIHLDITGFLTRANGRDIVDYMVESVIQDLKNEYPDAKYPKNADLMDCLLAIVFHTGKSIVMLIDEWDAICREYSTDKKLIDRYVNLLRGMFKSENSDRVFAGVYMTGILPIKQYGTQSALNHFKSYSMLMPEPLSTFYGFTEDEVKSLCLAYDMEYDEIATWYNGYKLGDIRHIFNPTSVIEALLRHKCQDYWPQTSSFDSIRTYINMNFNGVKEAIEQMLIGKSISIDTRSFSNDLSEIRSKDELFTLLVHFGYLAYDSGEKTVWIPNQEIREEMLSALRQGSHTEIIKTITASDMLLEATLSKDEEYVADQLDSLHTSFISPRHYNNEESLRSLIHWAYMSAIDQYVKIEELPTGKGFADVVFIPRADNNKPSLVVELKYDKDADSAIAQILRNEYPDILKNFTSKILLVGINYDKTSKKHECKIMEI